MQRGAVAHWVFGHVAPARFRAGLRHEIRRTLGTAPGPLLREIERLTKGLREAGAGRVRDAPSQGHLELIATLAAAHRVVRARVESPEAAYQLLDVAMLRSFDTAAMRAALRLVLALCRERPERFRRIFGWIMSRYGVGFEWSANPESPDGSFTLEVRRCFYFDFLSAHDLAQLTPILCRLDSIWFDAIDPRRHGFRFERDRYRTQGRGAPSCLFPIVAERHTADAARE